MRRLDDDDETTTQWSVTKEYTEAHYFKNLKTATRVLRGVRRLASRIEKGWLFEIIKVDEEIVGSNVPEEEREPAV